MTELEDAAADIRIVRVELVHGGPFRFSAGQYARVAFSGLPPRHCWMANRPDEPLLEFHLRYRRDGGAAAAVGGELRRGDGVWIEGPYGDAWLRATHSGPILAIVGGCGLAAAKSIVETVLRSRLDSDVRLYFGVRNVGDVYLAERFQTLTRRYANFHYVPVLSASAAPGSFRTGLVTDAVAADFATLAGYKAYIFGSASMTAAAADLLDARHMQPGDVHADAPATTVSSAPLRQSHLPAG